MRKIWYEGKARNRWRNVLMGLAVAVLLAGAFYQEAGLLKPVREKLATPGLEVGKVEFNRLHRLLIERGLVQVTGNENLPSSHALPPDLLADGVPTISILASEEDLFSQRRGIIPNAMERGRRWERPATVSYFEGGQLRYETRAGVKVHGGTSRGGEIKSFQVVFRRSYAGRPRSEEGVFFNENSYPMERIVLSNATKFSRFMNAIAIEMAAELGCLTSRSQPVRVVLNGELQKVGYMMYEHQSRTYLETRFGHKDFHWVRLKGASTKTARSERVFRRFSRQMRKYPYPMTMEKIAPLFDLENLAAWMLSVTYFATTDENQGGFFLDLRNPNAPWSSLAWDMDGSFHQGRTGRKHTFRLDGIKGIRGVIFRRLLKEDPEFQQWYRARVVAALDGTLSEQSIRERIERYRGYLRSGMYQGGTAEFTERLDEVERFLLVRRTLYLEELDRFIAKSRRNIAMAD